MEWRFTPVPKKLRKATPIPDVIYKRLPPGSPREAVQQNRIICYEGDTRCDFDPDLDNQSCTFRTEICINNIDPRYPLCDGTVFGGLPLETFEVISPRPYSFTLSPEQVANVATLENQGGAGGFGMTVVRRRTPVAAGSPNGTTNSCSAPMDLVLPLRQSSTGKLLPGQERIRIRSTNDQGYRDADKLRLICRPSTCGDGIVQEDHELCDDGNRSNCDLCDQACQPLTGPTCTPTATATPTSTPTDTPTETPTVTPTP
jgi:cysteine-rich repeat protein